MKQFCKKVILRIILLTVKIASNSHNSFSQFISKHFGEIKKCESNSEKNSISFASTVLTLNVNGEWNTWCEALDVTNEQPMSYFTSRLENITDMLFVDSTTSSHFGGLQGVRVPFFTFYELITQKMYTPEPKLVKQKCVWPL